VYQIHNKCWIKLMEMSETSGGKTKETIYYCKIVLEASINRPILMKKLSDYEVSSNYRFSRDTRETKKMK
jgi:hypothetical protein